MKILHVDKKIIFLDIFHKGSIVWGYKAQVETPCQNL